MVIIMEIKKIVYIVRPEVKVEGLRGYENIVFHNQLYGIQGLKQNPLAIVIDLGLKKVTGLDLIQIIRANPVNHKIKIIMCSKKYNHNLIKKCFDAGGDFYVSIPLDKNEIDFILSDIRRHYEQFDFTNDAMANPLTLATSDIGE